MLYREVGSALQVEVGVQVIRAFESSGAVVASTLPGGRVAMTTHHGPYDGLNLAYRALLDWCAAEGLQLTGTRWEIYGDWQENPSQLETEIYWLLA
jgi:effector-binding domain-containing protein